jgi:hypothetical protein
MGFGREFLLSTLASAALAACAGGRDGERGTETAAADSTTRAADSIAHATSSGPLRVSSVMVGKRLGQENRIAEPTFQFTAQDTVFVSVGLEGAPTDAQVSARWLAQTGKVLDSTSQSVSGAPTIKEFHLAQPKGWQPGTYLVTLYLNADSVEAKTFAVQ